MIRLLGILLTTLYFSSLASAQTLVLRSGEHDTFTRIATNLPANTTWNVEAVASGFEISFSGGFSEIDISNLFSRIGRERVESAFVDQDTNGVTFKLACDCTFKAFVENGDILVIDISETLLTENITDTSKQVAQLLSQAEPKPKFATLPLFSSHHKQTFGYPAFFDRPVEIDENGQQTEILPPEAVDSIIPIQEANPLQRETSQPLLNVIDEAAKRGVLSVDQQVTKPRQQSVEADILRPESNIKTNLTELFGPEYQTKIPVSNHGTNCFSESDLNIHDWAFDLNFSDGLARWNSSLAQELDILDPANVLALAKHYLHFGFGAEATVALSLLPELLQDHPMLLSMSRIMDQGQDMATGAFSGMFHCDSPAALWSALAVEVIPQSARLNTQAVRLAFEGLPTNLKEYLGPQLAIRLSEAGEKVAADAVLAATIRNSNISSPAAKLTKAKLSLNQNDPDVARQHLEEATDTHSEMTPKALIDLVDLAVMQEREIEPNIADLIAAHMFENRNTSVEADLSRVYVLALAHSGQFSGAIDQLLTPPGKLSKLTVTELTSQVVKRLIENASDVEFLNIASRAKLPYMTEMDRGDISERMLSLGFSELIGESSDKAVTSEFDKNQEIYIRKNDRVTKLLENESSSDLPKKQEFVDIDKGEGSTSVKHSENLMIENSILEAAEAPEGYELSKGEAREAIDIYKINPANSEEDPLRSTEEENSNSRNAPTLNEFPVLAQARNLIADSGAARIALQELLRENPVDQ